MKYYHVNCSIAEESGLMQGLRGGAMGGLPGPWGRVCANLGNTPYNMGPDRELPHPMCLQLLAVQTELSGVTPPAPAP